MRDPPMCRTAGSTLLAVGASGGSPSRRVRLHRAVLQSAATALGALRSQSDGGWWCPQNRAQIQLVALPGVMCSPHPADRKLGSKVSHVGGVLKTLTSSILKRLIKAGFNQAGFEIIRRKNLSRQTLLGMQSRPIRTVIDVGANTGQFARTVLDLFPNAKLYCFEPLPDPFDVLAAWAKTQEGRVVPINLAIGDKEGEVEMFLHEEHTPSSSLLATTKLTEQYYPFTKGQKRISVRQATLDAALAEVGAELSSEILIKLDVQGYEDRVIVGGRGLFIRASACIVEVCLDILYERQTGFRELLTMLDDLGYRYVGNLDQVYGEDGHCIFLDAAFIRETGRQ